MNIKTLLKAALVLGGLLAAGGGLAWWKYDSIRKAAAEPPMPEMRESVVVVEAKTVSWRPTAELSGTVIALQSVSMSNEVAGTVKEVLFESGAVVEAGQVLVTLDTTTEDADLAAAEASKRVAEAAVRTAEADLGWADANYKRMSQASEARVVPVADLDKARSELEGGNARVDKAKAEAEQAVARIAQVKSMIAKKTLRAPFKARVGLRNVHPGQYLKEGTGVVGLQSVSERIYLDFALPQEQAFRVKPGDAVMAQAAVLSAAPVRIDVVALDAVADSTTRNIRVRGIVDNPGGKLRPGMYVDVAVPVGESREYTVIPRTAVRRASYGDHVFALTEAKDVEPPALRANQKFVKLGASIGEDVIVMEGLSVGERIAGGGSFKLHENSLVNATPPGGRQPQAGAPGGEAGKETAKTSEKGDGGAG
ncbi:MAG: efflux RND transporter periplasmic adaptor subunit [Phycisphaerales bacterium]|nr:efflux RND transporter periplasmic adaptor subunit [Phycisphaerales bacterium]